MSECTKLDHYGVGFINVRMTESIRTERHDAFLFNYFVAFRFITFIRLVSLSRVCRLSVLVLKNDFK